MTFIPENADANMPLRDIIFRRLRSAILKGEMSAGDRLVEMKLAAEMGVSRSPVREAIHMLEKQGLVIIVPRCGAVVSSITDKDLCDVIEVREALEVLAVKLACTRMSTDDLERLDQANRVFAESIHGDVESMAEADEHFHDIIYEGANNEKLLTIAQNMREQMYRYRIEHLKNIKDPEQLVNDHSLLADKLRARDAYGAVEVIINHLKSQQELVRANIHRTESDK